MSEPALDFDAAMKQAAEAAGVPTDEETYAEFLQAGDTPPPESAEATPATAEPTPEPQPEPEVPLQESPGAEPAALLAGKYKTVEDLERAYKEAERRLGEQGNEIGTLRRELDERFVQLQSELRQPAYQPDPGSLDELLEEDPRRVVGLAVQRQDPLLYERGMRAWYDVDPFGANQYHLQAIQQAAAAAAQPQVDRAVAAAQQGELAQAMANVQGRHEDFNEVLGGDFDPSSLIQDGFPREILQGLNGDITAKESVFETLYRWRKAEQTGALREVAAQVAAETAEQTRAEKKAATVASASTTTPPEVPEDEAERMAKVFKDQDLSWRSGWTGQESRRR